MRPRVKVETQLLIERAGLDQEELLSGIRCPVLIIHGSKDEAIPFRDSENALRYLPKGSALRLLPLAKHSLEGSGPEIMAAAKHWLGDYLPLR